MISVRNSLEIRQTNHETKLKNIGFQKLKPSTKSTSHLNLVITVLFKKINNLYKKNLRCIWNNLANYYDNSGELPLAIVENNLIEKNIIANQVRRFCHS